MILRICSSYAAAAGSGVLLPSWFCCGRFRKRIKNSPHASRSSTIFNTIILILAEAFIYGKLGVRDSRTGARCAALGRHLPRRAPTFDVHRFAKRTYFCRCPPLWCLRAGRVWRASCFSACSVLVRLFSKNRFGEPVARRAHTSRFKPSAFWSVYDMYSSYWHTAAVPTA